MIFERVRSEGLAHISYYIGSKNEAAVIDPRRDCDPYFEISERSGTAIKFILETHRNEDYLIGSKRLSELTGARILHGPLDFRYGERVGEGEKIRIESLEIEALHTPGHTDESMSYVLTDRSSGQKPAMVFTGDALFVQEVGRTDLYGEVESERMAANLYESIFEKLLPLGDQVILCPAHGAGSACGGVISEREQSTLGLERTQNPRLQLSKEEFIEFKIKERLERPPYFKKMEELNLVGAPFMDHLPEPKPMPPEEFLEVMRQAVVVDTRFPPDFAGSHIPGSYSIWMDGFATFIGWVLPYDLPILLVVKDRFDLDLAVKELVREGYDNVLGYLKGGMDEWARQTLQFERIKTQSASEAKSRMDSGEDLTILDVRFEHEWEEGHIRGAKHIMAGELENRLTEIPKNKPILAFCSSGYRGSLAASVLQKHGFEGITNVLGGMTAWKNAGHPIVKP